uniref:F-box/kelch-repeat protein At3g23880-like n=1 Tax=Erigeron canadensis TaxID=72917 RepID=UPI001CB909E9|nr:F-box/kelch-repeat protein At3g23880-like [Erigeron canadensis]
MSDNIPFELQTEIIRRIPDTKSLIQFRSVSKAWKSVIDSKEFVKAHTLRHHQAHNRHHLLIRTKDCEGCEDCTGDIPISKHCDHCNYTPVEYYSIVDDESFPHQKVSVFVPDLVEEFSDNSVTIVTSHGLFCFYEYGMDSAVIWNPCIRKTVAIPVPDKSGRYYTTTIGFGVCPQNLEPKLVKITYVDDLSRLQDVNASTQVEVFTLCSGGTWRSRLSGNLPHISIDFGDSQAVVDGFAYWDAVDRIHVDDRTKNPNLIMSFDLTTEEFSKVNLPDSLALNHKARLSLCNLRESLAVLDCKINSLYDPENYHVWIMSGHGCTRSFDKMYSINAPGASIYTTLGFRKSGAPIIEVDNDKEDYYRHERALAIYEPESKNITNIGVYGLCRSFYVHSYMETLLLHGR